MSKRLSILLLTAPSMIVLLGVFLIPMLLMLLLSFQDDTQAFSLQNYLLFIQDPFYLEILWRTIRISLWTVLCTLL
ncbi:ABC transporter permease, partial [Anoxybacillus sp. LAT_38]|nr:ABC transporter permease [Anoxybacillus sp. LAT_38]